MKPSRSLVPLALLCVVSLLVDGCLFKKSRVSARHFILVLIPASETGHVATARPLQVEVGSVKMPSYLMRESLAVRESAIEFQYLDNAQWAERLDQCLRRTLTENLSILLASAETRTLPSGDTNSRVLVALDVKQFDVDTQGRGTLLVNWRLTRPGTDQPAKSGSTQLHQNGSPPQGTPQVVVTTLSALTAQFSRDLAKEIREFASAGHKEVRNASLN